MAPIEYEPTMPVFDWIDGQSRVKASGDDGFNRRFRDIEDEFKKISDTVKAIKAALDALGQAPAPKTVKTTHTPALVTLGSAGWTHIYGGVTKPGGATEAKGMMSLALPHGATLNSLRAVGRNTGQGALAIGLRRQGVAAGSSTQLIAPISGQGAQGGLFDSSVNIPASELSLVDTTQFRYYVSVELDAAAGGDTVQVTAIQTTYTD